MKHEALKAELLKTAWFKTPLFWLTQAHAFPPHDEEKANKRNAVF